MTYANDAPRGDGGLGSLSSLEIVRNGSRSSMGVVLTLAEPSAQLLLLLFRVGREVLGGAVFAFQKVWDEDAVLVLLLTGGQDVGALDGLVREAKDVIDDDDALGSIGRTANILSRCEHDRQHDSITMTARPLGSNGGIGRAHVR